MGRLRVAPHSTVEEEREEKRRIGGMENVELCCSTTSKLISTIDRSSDSLNKRVALSGFLFAHTYLRGSHEILLYESEEVM
jgi:hypothetical protein